jgi:hypothetical protein
MRGWATSFIELSLVYGGLGVLVSAQTQRLLWFLSPSPDLLEQYFKIDHNLSLLLFFFFIFIIIIIFYFFVYVKYMRKYCELEKVDLKILTDLNVVIPSDWRKVVIGGPLIHLCVCLVNV